MADGHALRAERIRTPMPPPVGVTYEGPWPW